MPARKLLLVLLVLLPACAADRGFDVIGVPDASDGDALHAQTCAGVEPDSVPNGVPGQFDGVWTTVGYDHDGVMDAGCSSDGTHELRHYLRLERGVYEQYERLYATSAECSGAAFDTGGEVRMTTRAAVQVCGEYYEYYDDRPTRQVIVTEPDAPPRYVMLKNDAPGDAYEQLSYGKTISDTPLDGIDTTTAWRTFRRPR